MIPILVSAIPFFIVLVLLEYAAFRHDAEDRGMLGYEPRDTRTSMLGGVGYLVVGGAWKVVVTVAFAGLSTLTPLHLDSGLWWFWPLLFLADDFSFYWFHRVSHTTRIFWASHVVHHSSERYNLSTALRQSWVPFFAPLFWIWMPLAGFPVKYILLAQSWNLLYQFWIHTERIGRMPRWFEAVFNTPSHHRVHHGSQEQYLDKNYAGILILWDRMFGSYEPEVERVRYGLTTNLGTYDLRVVQFHEYRAIWADLKAAGSWRERRDVLFRGPGWQPEHARALRTEPQAAVAAESQAAA